MVQVEYSGLTELRKHQPIQLQIHQVDEFGIMKIRNNYEQHEIPIDLKRNHEYTIEITPFGIHSSVDLKNMDLSHRDCRLRTELQNTTIFKVYTEANCRYECQVKLASEICNCIPWDFLHSNIKAEECEV